MSKTRSAERADFLASIAVTAAEGGIGYWSMIVSEYRWAFPEMKQRETDEAVEVADVTYTIAEFGDEGVTDESPRFEITLDTIARGLRLIREAKVLDAETESWRGLQTSVKFLSIGTRKAIMAAEREGDAGEIDSSLADVIVQVATLGEVRYG